MLQDAQDTGFACVSAALPWGVVGRKPDRRRRTTLLTARSAARIVFGADSTARLSSTQAVHALADAAAGELARGAARSVPPARSASSAPADFFERRWTRPRAAGRQFLFDSASNNSAPAA